MPAGWWDWQRGGCLGIKALAGVPGQAGVGVLAVLAGYAGVFGGVVDVIRNGVFLNMPAKRVKANPLPFPPRVG